MISLKVIAKEFRLRITASDFHNRIKVAADNLKQKIKSLGAILRRYNERTKRYRNNRLYYSNQKEFFRTLEKKVGDDGLSPDRQAIEHFWRGIWSEEVKHDESPVWLEDIEHQSWAEVMRDIHVVVTDNEMV